MTEDEFIETLLEQIKNGEALRERFGSLQETEKNDVNYEQEDQLMCSSPNPYDEAICSQLESDLYIWGKRIETILDEFWGKSNKKIKDEFGVSLPFDRCAFKEDGERTLRYNLMVLRSFLDRLKFINGKNPKKNTTYKVFISHSHKDKDFAGALVELLEFIGITRRGQLFCTSVDGYGIPSGKNICDYIREQFDKNRLFVIFIHSDAYYESTISLNEMGASWALRTDSYSFLVKDFDFDRMTGVINKSNIATKIDTQEAKGRLNEFKDKLVEIFNLGEVDSTRWETKRDEFLQKVNSLPTTEPTVDNKRKTEQTTFEASYLPCLGNFFDLLDVEKYPYWMYIWASSSDGPIIPKERYENFLAAQVELNRIDYKEEGFNETNSLIKNLSQLMRDYQFVCDQHLAPLRDGANLTIDQFYRKFPDGTRRDEATIEYYEMLKLIQDLSFELTKLLNLVLVKIRVYAKDFLSKYGNLTIMNEECEDMKYQGDEVSPCPYPGLRQFAENTRFTRRKFIGDPARIEYLRPLLDAYKE